MQIPHIIPTTEHNTMTLAGKGQVGYVIDTAVNYNANIVDLVEFDILDKEVYYLQALNLAIENAIRKADSIAKNLGLIYAPSQIRIIEIGTLPVSSRLLGSGESALTTPIEPGSKQIEANINIQFSY